MTQAKVNQLWVSGFTAETAVMMANGKQKPISKIQEGEWVASFDPISRKMEPGLVTGTWAEVMNDVLEINVDNKSMLVASSQRFFTPAGEFKSAPDTDTVLTQDGTPTHISAKKYRGGKVKLYDITVKDSHAFFAEGLMVHNKGGGKKAAPPPPPQPVVTAGKIGKPLTVTVNGNTISVPASPGSAARVSVAYNGAVTTSSPGVAILRGTLDLQQFPRVPNQLGAYNSMVSAAAIRDSFCNNISNSSGSVNSNTKNGWLDELNMLKKNVTLAQKNSGVTNIFTNWRCGTPAPGGRNRVDLTTGFDDTLDDINELKRFVKKNKNLTDKDITFIKGKCSELEISISKIQTSLQGEYNRVPPSLGLLPGVFFNDPRFYYYRPIGRDENDRPFYRYALPIGGGGVTNLPGRYYKHVDPERGEYFDLNPANAI